MKVQKVSLPEGGKWVPLTWGPLQTGDYNRLNGSVFAGLREDLGPKRSGVWFRAYDQAAKRVVFSGRSA